MVYFENFHFQKKIGHKWKNHKKGNFLYWPNMTFYGLKWLYLEQFPQKLFEVRGVLRSGNKVSQNTFKNKPEMTWICLSFRAGVFLTNKEKKLNFYLILNKNTKILFTSFESLSSFSSGILICSSSFSLLLYLLCNNSIYFTLSTRLLNCLHVFSVFWKKTLWMTPHNFVLQALIFSRILIQKQTFNLYFCLQY